MNKFNEIYNKLITEWNLSITDKTKLKRPYDESDEYIPSINLIEKYIDYSDTDWKWDESKTKFENILNLLNELKNDPPYSNRVSFILSLLTDEEQAKLQEIHINELYDKKLNELSDNY